MLYFLLSLFLIFVLFDNSIFNILSMQQHSTAWTVAFVILLFFIFVFYCLFFPHKIRLTKLDLKYLLINILIVVIGLVGNLKYKYITDYSFIIKDIIDFLKFPLSFILIKGLQLDKYFAISYTKFGKYVIKPIIVIIFVCGIISQFVNIGMTGNGREWHGVVAYDFLFSHPTYFTASCIFILALLTSIDSNKVYEFMIIVSTLLALRTKGVVTIAIYLLLKYGKKYLVRHKLVFLNSTILLAILVSWTKLKEYASFSTSPRESSYIGSFDILRDHFPLGSGFATYASHLSGQAYSSLYMNYPISGGFDLAGNPTAVLGDTGYPYYIAQFGLFGFGLFIYSFYILYKILVMNKFSNSSMLIYIYLLVSLTSESSLLNIGVEAAIILATVNYIENHRVES